MTEHVRPFDPSDLEPILAIATRARDHDEVDPLNEESRFALRDASPRARILVAVEGDEPVGVLVDAAGDASGLDLVVDPSARRRGVASALLAAAAESDEPQAEAPPRLHLWAHGDRAEAQAFAAAQSMERVRDLWRMTRPLSADEAFDVTLPSGLVARAFDGSKAQAEAWLAVNAQAFATHPEQGRMTLADFQERTREEWFDTSGLILVWDEASGELAASHWTKKEPGETSGEVYVVAVAPGFQGRGIAGPLTSLGLAHLRDSGATSVDLYVEGDNEPAKATYTRRGFRKAAQDVMYVHTPASSM